MSTKQIKHPGRRLLVLLIVIAVGYAALAIGAATHRASMTPGLALDLEGGTQIILTPTLSDGSAVPDEDVQQAIEVIRQRVDASGVAEAQISRQGGENIVVSLPGQPSRETLDLVRNAAVLYFRPVLRIIQGSASAIAESHNSYLAQSAAAASATPDAAADSETTADATDPTAAQDTQGNTDAATEEGADAAEPTAAATVTPEDVALSYADVNHDGQISSDPLPATSGDHSSDQFISEQMIYDAYMMDCTNPENLTGTAQDPSQAVISCAKNGSGTTYILGPADIAGTSVAHANSGLETTSQGTTTNKWVVSLEFNSSGTEEFAAVSQRLLAYRDSATTTADNAPSVESQKAQFAIVLDGLTLMASGFSPDVVSPITDGRVQITGDFTQAEANTLANQLSFGSLPLTFTVQSEQQISATLGIEQLRNGLIAGLIGFILIIAYLAWQYRGLALVAVASLIVAAGVTYLVIALLSWSMGYRLSLAGVAGLIISIGITMDSFIIYFERIRDEVRHGRTLVAAVGEGWVHARQTIIVSDTVNLVAAVVLYFLAVGGVQGFAFTLGVTTVVDLAVIIFFTHPMMVWILRWRFFGQGHRWSGLDPANLGARSLATYGKGREAILTSATTSLARRKAQAQAGFTSSHEDTGDEATDLRTDPAQGTVSAHTSAHEGEAAVDQQAASQKDGERK